MKKTDTDKVFHLWREKQNTRKKSKQSTLTWSFKYLAFQQKAFGSFNPTYCSQSLKTLSAWKYLNKRFAAATAKSLQSCLTLCDPIDSSPPGFSVPGILQARTLEWVAISFSNAWKWKVKVKSLSRVWL